MTSLEKTPIANYVPTEEELADIVGDTPTNIQERHPDWPKLHVEFYFSPHDNNVDTEGIRQHLQDADVLFIEGITPTKVSRANMTKILKVYNKLSMDPKTDLKKVLRWGSFHDTSDEPLLRGVQNTGIVVDSIDIGETADERAHAQAIEGSLDAIMPNGDDYQQTLRRYSAARKQSAALQLEREDMMSDKFESRMEQILSAHPKLMSKDAVKVLISMGSAHTTLRHALTGRGIESQRYFSQEKNYVYDYGTELIRTHSYGKEPSDELVKRAFAESVIRQAVERSFMDASIPTDEFMRYTRRYVSELSDEEMERIFDLWNKRMASTRNINALLVPAEMPPLAQTTHEIREANKLYDDRVQTLAAAAVQASSY